MKLSDKIQNIAPSATLEIDSLAKKLKSEGEPVIAFVAGEPDFKTPDFIVDSAREALLNPANFKYSPTGGLPELRKLIASRTTEQVKNQIEFNSKNVVVTNGGKQAVFETFAALLDEGDEVIAPKPLWLTYPEVIKFFGGKLKLVDDLSLESLKAVVSDKTKFLLLNSPNNPSGQVLTEAELKEIASFIKKTGIFVITDEIYMNLYYPENSYPANSQLSDEQDSRPIAPTLLNVSPEIQDQTIIINGVAKSYAMTGWRVGWIVAPESIASAVISLQSHLTSNVNNIAQRATLAALGDTDENYQKSKDSIEEMRLAFLRRRDLICRELSKVQTKDGKGRFTLSIPNGAFYAYVNVESLYGIPLGKDGDIVASASQLAKLILEKVLVACVPMEAFETPGYLRFSYALADDEIVEGVSRIQKFISE
ncbi:MAG: pyridoxal phosphate-dependent aminotransferase [Candidatus Ancillula sp.]|jgi:aspartate/methionine/tyrosine aminotransferase|nr:pyridoxal phosphate-dependent aminotransferase [Candidatus Ancillula sp.]